MAISDEERKKRLQRAQSIQANALNGKASGDERKQRLKEATEIQNKVLQEYNANKQQQEQEQQNRLTTISDIAHKAAEMGRKTADLSIDRNNRNETLQSLARKAAENQAFRNYNKDGFTMRESTGILNREDEKRIGKDTVAKVQNSPAMRFASQKVAEQTAKRDLEKLGVDNKETEKKISEIYRKNADISFDKKAKNSVTKTSEDFEEMLKEADKKMSYNELHDKMYNFIPNSKEEAQAYINTVDQMSNHNIEVSANKKMYVFAVDKALKAGAELSDEQKEKYTEFMKDIQPTEITKSNEDSDSLLVMPTAEKLKTTAEDIDEIFSGDRAYDAQHSTVYKTADSIVSGLMAGISSVGAGLMKAPKMISDCLGADSNAIFEWMYDTAEEGEATPREQSERANRSLKMSDEVASIVTSLESAVGQAISQLGMAIVSGGASEGVTYGSLMSNATRQTSSEITKTALGVANEIKELVKNPMFQTTFWTEAQDSYFEAVDNGADKFTAMSQGFTTGLLNSFIEMGGIESGETNFLKTAFEEGREEIFQGSVSGLMAKASYAPDIQWVSTDGSKAVFNLKELALSFVGGAIGGATAGGIATGSNKFTNFITTAQQRKALGDAIRSDENTLAAYIDMAYNSGDKKVISDANYIVNTLNKGELDSVASVTLGKFFQKASKAYQTSVINRIANAEKSDDTKANIKTASRIYTAIGQIINNPEYYLSDTLAVDIKHNPVAGEILTKSAGLQSRINEYTPVSTIREVARMVSNNISNGVRDNSNISIDQVGRPVNTNSPRAIDEGAIERVRDKTAKLDDYLSVTGKSLDSYRKDNGSYSADEIIAEANSVITELDRIKSENPVKASEPAAHDSIITENASTGMDVVNPQNVVTVKDDSITLDNGVTVPVTDELLSQNDSRLSDTTKKLYSASAEYKDNVKAAFISSYNGGNVDTYIKQFQNVYGVFELTGKLSEDERYDAVKYIEQALGKEAFNIARKAGQQARHEREQAKMRQNERQKASKENNQGKNKTAQRESESVRMYSINQNFANKFDKWDKKSIGFAFNIGTTSKILQSIGIDEKAIYWDASKILKIQKDHPQMTDSVIKQVPNILENPVLIMESLTVPDRLTLFGEVYDAKNNAVLAVLELNPKDKNGRALSIIKIASAYGKDTNPQGLINKSKILYTNKNRINRWLSVNRLQLPLPSYSTDSKNSISENQNAVKDIIRKNYKNSDTTQRKKGTTRKMYNLHRLNFGANTTMDIQAKAAFAGIVSEIAKEYNKRGINVDIIAEDGAPNGWYTQRSNTITVNLSAQNPLEAFLHETGHAIKSYAGEYWEEIKNAAFTYIAQIEDESISDLRRVKAEVFEQQSIPYTKEDIDEEIVSDAIGAMARDKDSVLKFYNALLKNGTKESFAKKIIRKLKEILMKLKAHFLDFDTIAVEYNSSVTRAVREGNTSKTPFFEYADKISNILSQSFENLQVTETKGDTKYSIEYDVNNHPYVIIEEDILKRVARKDVRKKVSTIIRDKFSPGIQVGNNYIKINAKSRNEFVNSKATQAYFERNKQIFADKMNSANNLDEIIWASRDYVEEAPSHKRTDNFDSFGRGQVQISIDNKEYVADIIIGHTTNNEMIFYDVINIRPTNIKKRRASYKVEPKRPTLASGHSASSNNTISQNDTVVNSNISENSGNDTRKFSLKEPIEETENLIAVHNLNIENLEKSLELGGLPIPSIAITKDKLGHIEFGEVSLVFGKDTIDPQINSANKIYSGDAYTPTFPRVEYKLSDSKLKEVADYFNMSQSYLEDKINASNIDYTVETLSDIHEIREQYLRDNNITLSEEEKDAYFSRSISGKNNFQKFKNYIRDKIKPIYIKRGIYNGADPFTPSGNSKSFEALHYEYTLENLVKAMRRGEQTNGIDSFSGAVTKQYNSVGELHKNENRIVKISDYERNKLIKSYQDKLSSIIDSMLGDQNSILYYDNAEEVIIESVRNGLSLNSISKILSEYKYAYNITEQTAKDIKSLAEDVQNLPTKYFESKPQRAVYFREVKKALLPQDASDKIIQDLYDAGVEKVEKYEDDIDRLNKLNSFDDVKFSLKEDTKKEWTPIKPTEKTQKVLDRLANNEYIPLDQIRMLKEINEAYTKRGDFEPTININTPYRQNLRLKIQDDVEKLGSARLDENGKWVYDNPIRKEKRIDVVIGLPAVGKSTVFADPLSNEHGSRIVDCDIIKEKLPEFNQGYGSDNVHQESKIINDKILQKAMYNGENIVLPIIGSEYNKLVKRLEEYKNLGYSVHLHLNEVPQNKALGRMLNRYFEQGRFLNPSLPYEYQNKPTEVFNRIIAERGDLLDGYSHYSNDVRRGEEPIFIKGTERTRKADVSGGNEENRRAISENDRRGRRDVYDVNNATSEQPDDKKDPFRKYSLLEDIDIKLAKKAYERNKKLQVDTQVVKDLFEKAGRVLDKTTVDAVADKIAKRYYFGGDSKMKQLLRDKLYAFYTYVSREDAVDAQIALYGYEVSKDIVAMSKEVSGFTDGENVYEEYGESIYDVIYADLINEYANTAIIQAPQRLQEEHEKIAERYRKAEPDSEEKKSLYRELEVSRDELVAARERYTRSREEVKKLDSLLRKTQSYYKRKLDSKKAKSLAYSLRPEQKRIRNKEIMKLVGKYGAYPQNEYSKVDAYVPKRDSRGLAVSRVPKTIIESDYADEKTINTINNAMLDGALSHEIKSNKSAQKYAERSMEKGFDEARVEFKKEIEKIKTFADDTPNRVALAKALIEEAQRRGDQDTVRDIVTDLAIYGLLGGRTTQAFNMLRATGATGQALYLEKWVQRRNKEIEKEWDKKWITNVREDIGKPKEFKPLVLNRELMQRLVNATDEEEITELSSKIMADLALQENSTLSDKIQAWRYMSMLTNPTTHIRNIVGNGIFAILREGQNTVRVGLEKALNKVSGGKIKLTTVVKIKDEYKKFAKEDWKKFNSLARKSGKYNIDDFIMQEKKIFRSKVGKPIEKVRTFNSDLLEKEDLIFIKYAYTRALGRYLQAQKISLEENSDPKLEQERQSRIEEARAYALEESLIATYRNANAVATALTQLANKNAAFDILVNSVMPFKKTPANIFVQSMKYSPIGIGLGIKQIVFDGIKHQKTANQIIDTFASGITGTGVFLLGLLLRRLGILQGMFDDDDGDDQIDKMEKIQENSINLFGQSFTIDWSAPAIVPLMMGAEFSDGIGNFQFDGSLTDNIWQIVSRSVDPLINMTMLEGLNDMLTSIKYSENNSIGELGFRAISNYTSQFIPTVGGKIARTLDGTSRMTYIDPDDNDFLSRNIQNVQKKSPFWYSDLQPIVDEWGREDKEGNVATRILENFISPGYWETIDSDDATDVIEDLYDELQDKSLLPKKPEKSFTMYVEYFDGEKHKSVKDEENYKNGKRELSGDEYTTAALSQGQTQHDLIAELKGNSVYESMNGAEKAAVIENIYKFAKYAGEYAVDDSYYGSEQEKWCRELNEQRSSLTGILNEILNRSREK